MMRLDVDWTKNVPIFTELREILHLFSNLLINDVKCEKTCKDFC